MIFSEVGAESKYMYIQYIFFKYTYGGPRHLYHEES